MEICNMESNTVLLGCLSATMFLLAVAFCGVAMLWPRLRKCQFLRARRSNVFVFLSAAAAATCLAQKPTPLPVVPVVPPELVYRTSFDSVASVENPTVGPTGTCNNASFVDGKFGKAMYVPVNTLRARIPLPNGLPVASGCIEFWAKINTTQSTFADGGCPTFFAAITQVAMEQSDHGWYPSAVMGFNSNNGGGKGGLTATLSGYGGLAPYSYLDNRAREFSAYFAIGTQTNWHHYALVWNTNGVAAISGSPNAAILLDGNVICTSSRSTGTTDEKYVENMTKPMYLIMSRPDNYSKVPYCIDEFRIWSTDVTEFAELPELPEISVFGNESFEYDGKPHTIGDPLVDVTDIQYRASADGDPGLEPPTITDAGEMKVWYSANHAVYGVVEGVATVTVVPRQLTFESASAEKTYDGTPLTNGTVVVKGTVPDGEGFTFAVDGSRTMIGTSQNTFTWAAADGTKASNYAVAVRYGKLTITPDAGFEGVTYSIENDAETGEAYVVVSAIAFPSGGDVTLPATIGGLPVKSVSGFDGTGVTSVSVPAGINISGVSFKDCVSITGVTFAADCDYPHAMSFYGCENLREVVMPRGASIRAGTFHGCWALERVVFRGEPVFGYARGDMFEPLAPASLLMMADMICYPASDAAKWRKILRNVGYGGWFGTYEGEWTGLNSLVADFVPAGGGEGGGGEVQPSPGVGPAAQYTTRAGDASGVVLDGASGWDALCVPDGMAWDRSTGSLTGAPNRSGRYDVILVSGSGVDTKIMRTSLEVAGYDPIVGCVGVAFSASGSPVDSLSSYKSLPSGLAWKGGVLSGVPKKDGAYEYTTLVGEPVEVLIRALPSSAAGTFNGTLAGADGQECPLKLTATAAGAVSASVTVGTKSYTMKAPSWAEFATVDGGDGAEHRVFRAVLTGSGGLSMSVELDADAAWDGWAVAAVCEGGALDGLSGSAQRDSFASSAEARAAAAGLVGTHSLDAAADDEGCWVLSPAAGKGAVTVKVKDNGTATVSGKLPDKTAASGSATVLFDEDGPYLAFYLKGKWAKFRR